MLSVKELQHKPLFWSPRKVIQLKEKKKLKCASHFLRKNEDLHSNQRHCTIQSYNAIGGQSLLKFSASILSLPVPPVSRQPKTDHHSRQQTQIKITGRDSRRNQKTKNKIRNQPQLLRRWMICDWFNIPDDDPDVGDEDEDDASWPSV